MVSFLQSLLLLFHFCVYLLQLSELVWKLAEERTLQSASKCFPSFGPPANGNKSIAKKSRFRPNRSFTETIYHWSVILRRFSVVLNSAKLTLLASFDFSRHPVQKSKSGTCTVTGYCSFKWELLKRMTAKNHVIFRYYVRIRTCMRWLICNFETSLFSKYFIFAIL